MKFVKKLLAAALCAAMTLSFGGFAAAQEEVEYKYAFSFVNDGGDPPQPTQFASVMEVAPEQYADAAMILRQSMEARAAVATLSLSGVEVPGPSPEEQNDPDADDGVYDTLDLGHDIFAAAITHDPDDPKGGDYLWRHFHRYGFRTGYRGSELVYEFTLEYNSTAEQEEQVDAVVAELRSDLGLGAMTSDYDKIKAVYDWICKNVDYTSNVINDQNDPGYRTQFSTYSAIIQKSTVCQGYATLFYRMMLEEGIDCRYISGRGQSTDAQGNTKTESHGWNIVELDGEYYFADTTWDTSYMDARETYNYFLRCEKDFERHTDYDLHGYELSPYCYGGAPVTSVTVGKSQLDLEPGASETVTASVAPSSSYCKTVLWESENPAVASVDAASGLITAVASGRTNVNAVAAGGVKGVVAVTVAGEETDDVYKVETSGDAVPEEGGSFRAQVTLTKTREHPGEDAVVMRLKDKDGKTVGVACIKVELKLGQTVTFGARFTAPAGSTLEAQAQESLSDATALSNILTI